ncbi:MAG: hypothetical protein EBU90_16360 [Proteobacteria bacterium]|nr:hypothetical protein [Pseudomonadota bacterium]NBP14414.1 hypothetical protein [bacterium]
MDVSRTALDLPKSFQKALKKDVQKIINYISVNFDVYKRGTQQLTGETELLDQVLTALMIEEPLCAAITKNGSKCIRKAQAESKYCRQHAFKAFTGNYTTPLHTTPLHTAHTLTNNQNELAGISFVECNPGDGMTNEMASLKKHFIEDSFYWVDEQYIYDLNNYNRVGYIDTQTSNPEYVLTDDPFLLN